MTFPQVPRRFLALAVAALLAGPAPAQSPQEGFEVREFTCPVGGEKFTQDVGYATLVLVQFGDGSWLGDTGIDAQIPECPGNGLVLIPDYEAGDAPGWPVYRDYRAAELARLPALIHSGEYRALKAHGRHERALWLATQLQLPARVRWELLVRASWATTEAGERRRLVARIADEGPALVAALSGPAASKLGAGLQVANALRELGRFDAAAAQLATVEAAIEAGVADEADADARDALAYAVSGLAETIAARDDDRFPIGTSSSRFVDEVCAGGEMPPPYGPTTANARAACARRAQERAAMAEALDESDRLQQDPAQLQRLCADTPAERREPGLAEACRMAQRGRDEFAGERLARREPRETAARCATSEEFHREGPLEFACRRYESTVQSALVARLDEVPDAYVPLCRDSLGPGPDAPLHVTLACQMSEFNRDARADAAKYADPVALDAACAATPGDAREFDLDMACLQRALQLQQPEIDRLAADDAAFAAACGEGVQSPSGLSDDEADLHRHRCNRARVARRERAEPARRAAAIVRCRETGELQLQDDGPTIQCAELLAEADDPTRSADGSDSELQRAAREHARRIVDAALAGGGAAAAAGGDGR